MEDIPEEESQQKLRIRRSSMKKKTRILGVLMLCMMLCVSISVSAKDKNSSDVEKKTIYINQTVKLEVPSVTKKVAKSLTWKSSNKKVVRVTAKGKITGVKKGTAVITASSKKDSAMKYSFKVTVKKLKLKMDSVKITKPEGSHISYLKNLMNKEYVVIESMEELNDFVNEIRLVYNENNYDLNEKFDQTKFYKKLAGYNKKFFQKKALCILENALPSSMQNVQTEDFIRIQKKSGKVCGQLTVSCFNKNDAMTADMFYETYFVELKKSDAETLQGYQLKIINQ